MNLLIRSKLSYVSMQGTVKLVKRDSDFASPWPGTLSVSNASNLNFSKTLEFSPKWHLSETRLQRSSHP